MQARIALVRQPFVKKDTSRPERNGHLKFVKSRYMLLENIMTEKCFYF